MIGDHKIGEAKAGAAFVNVALDGQDAEAVCRVEKKLHVPLEKVRKVLKIAKAKEPRHAPVTRRGFPRKQGQSHDCASAYLTAGSCDDCTTTGRTALRLRSTKRYLRMKRPSRPKVQDKGDTFAFRQPLAQFREQLPPSPGWTRALPPGPDLRVKITEEYANHVARDAFFWAWPLVNIYNKRRGAEQSKVLAYAGPVPAAPLNRIVMLTDYVAADERIRKHLRVARLLARQRWGIGEHNRQRIDEGLGRNPYDFLLAGRCVRQLLDRVPVDALHPAVIFCQRVQHDLPQHRLERLAVLRRIVHEYARRDEASISRGAENLPECPLEPLRASAGRSAVVACPNQDVVYGGGSLGLEQSPVVIQVPDFGDRFWVYQAVDLRSDSFVQLGKMYGTSHRARAPNASAKIVELRPFFTPLPTVGR